VKIVKWVLLAAVLIQFVPYGHTHTNPSTTKEPAWDSPQTRYLVHRACFDCHSNQTTFPWYSNVAPVSWLLQRDVNGGRSHLNFTEWDLPQKHAKDVSEEVKQGDMPPWFYLPLHPAARLTAGEKQALMDGAEKTLGPQAGPEKKLQKAGGEHSLRTPGHLYLHRHLVFGGNRQERRWIDFEIRERGGNGSRYPNLIPLCHYLECHLLILRGLTSKLDFQIGMDGGGCGCRFG